LNPLNPFNTDSKFTCSQVLSTTHTAGFSGRRAPADTPPVSKKRYSS